MCGENAVVWVSGNPSVICRSKQGFSDWIVWHIFLLERDNPICDLTLSPRCHAKPNLVTNHVGSRLFKYLKCFWYGGESTRHWEGVRMAGSMAHFYLASGHIMLVVISQSILAFRVVATVYNYRNIVHHRLYNKRLFWRTLKILHANLSFIIYYQACWYSA